MAFRIRNTILVLIVATFVMVSVVTESPAVPLQWTVGAGGNDHFYDFIPCCFIYPGALADAATKAHLGQPGYLATVTSLGEDAFIRANVTTELAWLSGTDAVTEGDWKWDAGPEAGQSFWIDGVTQPGFVALWGPGEPNNLDDVEDFLHMNWHAAPNTWNDCGIGCDAGYIVEFNPPGPRPGVPEPATLALLGAGLAALAALRRRCR